jgi:hypothetical protein
LTATTRAAEVHIDTLWGTTSSVDDPVVEVLAGGTLVLETLHLPLCATLKVEDQPCLALFLNAPVAFIRGLKDPISVGPKSAILKRAFKLGDICHGTTLIKPCFSRPVSASNGLTTPWIVKGRERELEGRLRISDAVPAGDVNRPVPVAGIPP